MNVLHRQHRNDLTWLLNFMRDPVLSIRLGKVSIVESINFLAPLNNSLGGFSEVIDEYHKQETDPDYHFQVSRNSSGTSLPSEIETLLATEKSYFRKLEKALSVAREREAENGRMHYDLSSLAEDAQKIIEWNNRTDVSIRLRYAHATTYFGSMNARVKNAANATYEDEQYIKFAVGELLKVDRPSGVDNLVTQLEKFLETGVL